jgi:hypothetical protein
VERKVLLAPGWHREAVVKPAFRSPLLKDIENIIDKQIKTSVVGCAQKNEWGGSRQEEIFKCKTGTLLKLIPEPENEANPKAVAVCVNGGDYVGYLKKSVASEIFRDMVESKRLWVGCVEEVTGFTNEQPNFGLEIVAFRFTTEYIAQHAVRSPQP